jgi:hypothetical protein
MAHWVGVSLFWGGLSAMLIFIVYRWGPWMFGHGPQFSSPSQSTIDNSGGVFIGGDNAGTINLNNGQD